VTLSGAAAWSPDGRWVAVGGQGEVALLDASNFAVLRLFKVKDLVNSLDVDPSGQRIAVATSGSTITVHPVAGGEPRRLDGHLSSVGVVRCADAGQLLVSGGYDGQAIVWSVSDATPSTILDPGGGAVWDLAVSGDDVLTATSAGLLSLHSLNQGTTRCRVALDTALSSCGFSRVGRLAAAGGSAAPRSSTYRHHRDRSRSPCGRLGRRGGQTSTRAPGRVSLHDGAHLSTGLRDRLGAAGGMGGSRRRARRKHACPVCGWSGTARPRR